MATAGGGDQGIPPLLISNLAGSVSAQEPVHSVRTIPTWRLTQWDELQANRYAISSTSELRKQGHTYCTRQVKNTGQIYLSINCPFHGRVTCILIHVARKLQRGWPTDEHSFWAFPESLSSTVYNATPRDEQWKPTWIPTAVCRTFVSICPKSGTRLCWIQCQLHSALIVAKLGELQTSVEHMA